MSKMPTEAELAEIVRRELEADDPGDGFRRAGRAVAKALGRELTPEPEVVWEEDFGDYQQRLIRDGAGVEAQLNSVTTRGWQRYEGLALMVNGSYQLGRRDEREGR